jgi:hypothetical protein
MFLKSSSVGFIWGCLSASLKELILVMLTEKMGGKFNSFFALSKHLIVSYLRQLN